MKNTSKTILWALLVAFSLFLSAGITNAQSGRRKSNPAPAAPIPTPTPEPTPTPKSENNEPELIFLVGADRNGTYDYYPPSFYDAVVRGCADALRHSSAGVDVSGGDLPRGQAIKKAKDSAKTYVVVLELKNQRMMGVASTNDYDQIDLEYVVFTPGKGKVLTSGRTYQNAARKGPVSVGLPTGGSNSALYREALLRRAGEDAGERILGVLNLKTN